ncbi:MAG TPA: lysophospholipid acyltransferase family protein, partial [bacterium]|nr:lysophospholipid acyltransferase family protein [bacterium]
RGTADRAAIRHSLEVLAQGGVLLIFPEGTRSPDGRLQSPEPGAALLALRSGAPVLPVAVINSHRVMRKGRRLPSPFGRIVIRFGPPLAVPRIAGRLDHAVLAEWGERIIAAIEALLPPEQRRAR